MLAAENLIKDGFYDVGSAGSNREHMSGFPTLESLLSAPIDKKREVLLVNRSQDPELAELHGKIVDDVLTTIKPTTPGANTLSYARVSILKSIAKKISDSMGGANAENPSKKSDDFGYKFHIAELKISRRSNVLPIGSIRHGTFYHRALIFKVVADQLLDDHKKDDYYQTILKGREGPVLNEARGMASKISLVRGEYGRAWNVIALKPFEADQATKVENPLVALGAREEEYLIDLMFQPGRLMKLGSPEAVAYQRIAE